MPPLPNSHKPKANTPHGAGVAIAGPPEEASFDQLEAVLERYRGALRQAISQTCPASYGIDWDDIEQDAILRLHKALVQRLVAQLQDQQETGNLSAAYVRRIGVTAAIDAIRVARQRREDQLEAGPNIIDQIESPHVTPEHHVRSREISRRIRGGLEKLSEERRRAVQLHLQGFSSIEIAKILRSTKPKARNLAYRGLADLRRILARDDQQPQR